MIRNVHERHIDAPVGVTGRLLDGLGRDEDRLWPSPAWVPMRLDRPVQVGAAGGHGPIRYEVTEYEPGRRVRFQFHPGVGALGFHELRVEPLGPKRSRVTHELVATTSGSMRVLWPLAVRWLHDAVLEDLLDNAERESTGIARTPSSWSRWVRFLRRHTEFPWPRAVEVPAGAGLVRAAFDRVDLEDAWRVRVAPGMPTDPLTWADAVFRNPPAWVRRLLRLRNALVGLVGIDRGDASAFDPIARSAQEVLLGTDERHLDFRGSVYVEDETVTLSTVVRIKNRRGRLYMAVVWPLHGWIVRSMLRRTQYALAELATREVARPAA